MTGKEALEELYKLTCIDNRNNVWTSCELCAVILKDLERLKELEKEYNTLKKEYDTKDLECCSLQRENHNLKKAIKIINNALELYVDFYEVGVENRSSFIEYEDSELLKEVLNYE